MSYKDAADALNARFGTAYSRSATLGRARRMRLAEPEWPKPPPLPGVAQLPQLRERRTADDFRPREFFRRPPAFGPVDRAPLRCIEIAPRHFTLIELERGDCRFPYGGDMDGEAITSAATRAEKARAIARRISTCRATRTSRRIESRAERR